MRRKLFVATAVIALSGFGLAACSTNTPAAAPATSAAASSSAPASAPSASSADRTGDFMGLNGKKVAGTATVSGTEIKLAGFSSDMGPDLHIYLTNGTDEAAVNAGKEVSAVKYDAASQTFTLDGVQASGYTDVVIHCDKAKAVFGAAKLA